MVAKSRRHHYVPRFYLEGFYDHNEKLFVYDRLKKRYSRPVSSKSIAFEAGYYFVENESGKESVEVEQALGIVESKAKPVLAKMINGEEISRDERIAMSAFIALQSQRVPHIEKLFRETSQMAGLALMKESAKMGYFAKHMNESKSKKPSPFEKPEDIDNYIIKAIDEGRITENVHKNNVIRFMFENASELEIVYFNSDWTIVEAPKGSSFVTSDNPVANIGKGFIGNETIRFFHLNPKFALVIGNKGIASNTYRKATKREVNHLNNEVAIRSDRYVISNDEKLLSRVIKRNNLYSISTEPRSKINILKTPNGVMFNLEHLDN